MNSIATIQKRVFSEPHLDITVDGESLDEAATRVLGLDCRGLVPCLLPWSLGVEAEREHQISVERILPSGGDTTVAPLLMCPDDLDFHCTLVVVEVVHSDVRICWNRMGTDVTHWSELPENVGSAVEWAPAFGGWNFDRAEYQAIVDAFSSLDTEWS